MLCQCNAMLCHLAFIHRVANSNKQKCIDYNNSSIDCYIQLKALKVYFEMNSL